MKPLFKLVFLVFLSIYATSCTIVDPIEPVLGEFQNGYFIVNEGPFSSSYGTISFLSEDFNTTQPKIFEAKNNNAHLGSIVQDVYLNNEKAFIVANNSNKITITNRYTMVKTGEITTGLSNPRYVVVVGNYAYVSNWGDAMTATDDFIAVVNLSNNTVSGTIAVSEGPEKMAVIGNYIYVLMKGGWGSNNKVTVINSSNNLVQTTLTVGDNPQSYVVKDSDLYVMCPGKTTYQGNETAGVVYKINTSNNTAAIAAIFATTEHPQHLNYSNNNFYYNLNGGVYKWNGTANLPTTAESNISGFLYGMNIYNGKLFTLDAGNYSSNGTLKIYDLSNNNLLKTVITGIIPNSVELN